MFDAAFVVLLVLAALRARRARLPWAAALALGLLAFFLATTLPALAGDPMTWGTAGAFGLAFVGPSAILQERPGLLGVLTHPLATSLVVVAASMATALTLARRVRALYPESAEARGLHRAEIAFTAVACFAATRLVTALLALALWRDA